jgi:hypothetical protein
LLTVLSALPILSHAQVLGDPVDVSQDFQKMENIYFIGSKVTSFDAFTGQGTLQYKAKLKREGFLRIQLRVSIRGKTKQRRKLTMIRFDRRSFCAQF